MTDDELIERVARAIAGDDFAQRDLYECAKDAIAAVREAEADEIDRLRAMVEAAYIEGFADGQMATSPIRILSAWHSSKARAALQETDR